MLMLMLMLVLMLQQPLLRVRRQWWQQEHLQLQLAECHAAARLEGSGCQRCDAHT